MSAEMLRYARERIERAGWQNVELVESDMAEYEFPQRVDGVLSTGAFGFVRESDRVIERAARALGPHGRLVILDVKRPKQWPRWLFKIFLWVGRPFGVTLDYFARHPWKTVERTLADVTYEEMYWGLVYLSSGTVRWPAA